MTNIFRGSGHDASVVYLTSCSVACFFTSNFLGVFPILLVKNNEKQFPLVMLMSYSHQTSSNHDDGPGLCFYMLRYSHHIIPCDFATFFV